MTAIVILCFVLRTAYSLDQRHLTRLIKTRVAGQAIQVTSADHREVMTVPSIPDYSISPRCLYAIHQTNHFLAEQIKYSQRHVRWGWDFAGNFTAGNEWIRHGIREGKGRRHFAAPRGSLIGNI